MNILTMVAGALAAPVALKAVGIDIGKFGAAVTAPGATPVDPKTLANLAEWHYKQTAGLLREASANLRAARQGPASAAIGGAYQHIRSLRALYPSLGVEAKKLTVTRIGDLQKVWTRLAADYRRAFVAASPGVTPDLRVVPEEG